MVDWTVILKPGANSWLRSGDPAGQGANNVQILGSSSTPLTADGKSDLTWQKTLSGLNSSDHSDISEHWYADTVVMDHRNMVEQNFYFEICRFSSSQSSSQHLENNICLSYRVQNRPMPVRKCYIYTLLSTAILLLFASCSLLLLLFSSRPVLAGVWPGLCRWLDLTVVSSSVVSRWPHWTDVTSSLRAEIKIILAG